MRTGVPELRATLTEKKRETWREYESGAGVDLIFSAFPSVDVMPATWLSSCHHSRSPCERSGSTAAVSARSVPSATFDVRVARRSCWRTLSRRAFRCAAPFVPFFLSPPSSALVSMSTAISSRSSCVSSSASAASVNSFSLSSPRRCCFSAYGHAAASATTASASPSPSPPPSASAATHDARRTRPRVSE